MRRTPFKPQFWKMSVALEDQGESVPGRGMTSSKLPRVAWRARRGPYSSNESTKARSDSESDSGTSRKWTNSAYTEATEGSSSRQRASSLARRNSERAGAPRRVSMESLGEGPGGNDAGVL